MKGEGDGGSIAEGDAEASGDRLTRYRELRLLGHGGMATVTLAQDTLLRRRVALKRVHAHAASEQASTRLRREALVGARLSHPNLVAVYDVAATESDLVVVMEYVEGETLRDLLARGPLAPARTADLIDALAAALDHVHAHAVVHRDVKPANVLLGDHGAIKLADLGIASAEDRTRITTAGAIMGTFSYMAPEQLEGSPPAPAMDIYALAAVAFEALGGRKARPEPNPVALARAIATAGPPDLRDSWPGAPPAAAAVLRQAMDAIPARRPRSASELASRLRSALIDPASQTVGSPAPSLSALPARSPRAASGTAPRAASTAAPRAAPIPVSRAALTAAPRSASSRTPRTAPGPAAEEAQRPASPPAGKSTRRRDTGLAAVLVAAAALAALIALTVGSGGSGSSRAHPSSSGPAAEVAQARHSAIHPGASGASSGSGGASTTPPAPASSTPVVSATPTADTPAGAVQAFYQRAAAHQFASAWALADPQLRQQVAGFASFSGSQSRVSSITFHSLSTTNTAPTSAAVGFTDTSVVSGVVHKCHGTILTVRPTPTSGWLLHQLQIADC